MSFPLSAIMKASGNSTYSAFSRYSNLRDGDIQVSVGRKTKPLPCVTFEEFNGAVSNQKNAESRLSRLLIAKISPS
jgi:hypothetical protein